MPVSNWGSAPRFKFLSFRIFATRGICRGRGARDVFLDATRTPNSPSADLISSFRHRMNMARSTSKKLESRVVLVNPVSATSGRRCPARRFRQVCRDFPRRASLGPHPSHRGMHEFLTWASNNFYPPCRPYTGPESYGTRPHAGRSSHNSQRFRILVINRTNVVRYTSYERHVTCSQHSRFRFAQICTKSLHN